MDMMILARLKINVNRFKLIYPGFYVAHSVKERLKKKKTVISKQKEAI
jgi:hypothetical protein